LKTDTDSTLIDLKQSLGDVLRAQLKHS